MSFFETAPTTAPVYRSRLAPSPTGYLHIGHARTFWTAQRRCDAAAGTLILRNEDLDRSRCRPEFVAAMLEDLRWFGLSWAEGPDCGGRFGPYSQSERNEYYREAFEKLAELGLVYPCRCSRMDVLRALQAPHAGEDEPIYPGTCRPRENPSSSFSPSEPGSAPNWRFRVPEGEEICFTDGCCGKQCFTSGVDFGDFVVWRHDQTPSYQLAVVVDDAAMRVTEVVRGQDLLRSTARQVLLYRALGLAQPAFYHCPLVSDGAGVRLAKRHDALSLRTLRAQGLSPEDIRARWA
jgi:glutamyl-tRNA synthetase